MRRPAIPGIIPGINKSVLNTPDNFLCLIRVKKNAKISGGIIAKTTSANKKKIIFKKWDND